MPKYSKTVIAALIVVAIAIAWFIYSSAKNGSDSKPTQPNVVKLNPGADLQTPKSAPSVTAPTTPPPSN